MIIDTAVNCTHKLDALKKAGVTTVIRYLTSSKGSSKIFTPAEARAFNTAGMHAGLVFEVWGGEGNFKHGDIDAAHGEAHGKFVRGYLDAIGASFSFVEKAPVVFFAIDTDVSARQIRSYVLPYFDAIKPQLPRVGIYGAGAACDAVLKAELADAAWLAQSKGWNGYKSFLASGRWTLAQGMPKRVAGIDCDPDMFSTTPLDDFRYLPFST